MSSPSHSQKREPWHEPAQKPPLLGLLSHSTWGYPPLQPLTATPVTQGRVTQVTDLEVGAPHPLGIIPISEISLEIGLISERTDKN